MVDVVTGGCRVPGSLENPSGRGEFHIPKLTANDIRVVAGFLMFECLTLERSLSTLYFVHSLLNSLL